MKTETLMKINQTTIRILSLLLLAALLIPLVTVVAFAEEAYDDPSLPDVFDKTIPKDEEDTSDDAQTNSIDETEPLPAFTVAVISLATIGLLLGVVCWIHHLSARKNAPKKKK